MKLFCEYLIPFIRKNNWLKMKYLIDTPLGPNTVNGGEKATSEIIQTKGIFFRSASLNFLFIKRIGKHTKKQTKIK